MFTTTTRGSAIHIYLQRWANVGWMSGNGTAQIPRIWFVSCANSRLFADIYYAWSYMAGIANTR